MSTPTPPGPDEPVLDSFTSEDPAPAPAPAEPVLDSFAAEEPAEPADAATGASTPVVLPASDVPGTLGSPAAAEPEPVAPAAGPRGSEGLTTAPPPLTAHPVEAAPDAPEEPAPSDAPAPQAEPGAPAPAEPAADEDPQPEPALAIAAGYPLPPPEADEPADHLASSAAPVEQPARGRRRAWLPLTAVGLAVALLAAGTGALAWQLRQQDRADQAAVDAVAAARDAARLLFSYDHKTLQADFDKGLAVTTGDFREQYQRTTKDVVSPVAVQYKAVVKAEVVEAAVIDARADEVTALVFLNQATTSTRVQGQQVDQSRVRMRLVPRDGRWLVEEVKAL